MMNEQRAKQPRPASTRTATRSQARLDEEHTASPHRAGFTAGLHPECSPYTSSEQSTHPPASRTTPRAVPVAVEDAETLDDEDDDALYAHHVPHVVRRYDRTMASQRQEPHSPAPHGTRTMQVATPQTIVRVHRQPVPQRRSRTQESFPETRPAPHVAPTMPSAEPVTHTVLQQKSRFHVHWLVYVGLIVLVGVGVCVGVSTMLHWWQGYQDDVHYGRPRTYQCDARVGHNDAHTPSHFIALNLHKHVDIIEFPGGDATHARVYLGPTLVGDGQDLTPVTLTFADVNGDGKPDMLLHIGTQSTLVYINDNGAFRPATASDHLTL